MTDNEIIKALECCLCADTVMECHECTYIGENNCLNSMITDVLDLINRQKAEIETMKNYEELYKELMISYCKLTDRLLERLNETREKNKHLTAMVEAAEEYLQPLPFKNAFDEEIEKAKSEAIREFAEILKNKSQLVAPSVYAEPFRAVSVEEIDRLAKRK